MYVLPWKDDRIDTCTLDPDMDTFAAMRDYLYSMAAIY